MSFRLHESLQTPQARIRLAGTFSLYALIYPCGGFLGGLAGKGFQVVKVGEQFDDLLFRVFDRVATRAQSAPSALDIRFSVSRHEYWE